MDFVQVYPSFGSVCIINLCNSLNLILVVCEQNHIDRNADITLSCAPVDDRSV